MDPRGINSFGIKLKAKFSFMTFKAKLLLFSRNTHTHTQNMEKKNPTRDLSIFKTCLFSSTIGSSLSKLSLEGSKVGIEIFLKIFVNEGLI